MYGKVYRVSNIFFIFDTRKLSVNRKDIRAQTLVGLTRQSPELDPLLYNLDNRLYIILHVLP